MDELMYAGDSNDVRIKDTLGTPLYWDDVNDCTVEGETYYKGFGAHVEGEFDVEFTYGFTMIVDWHIHLAPLMASFKTNNETID